MMKQVTILTDFSADLTAQMVEKPAAAALPLRDTMKGSEHGWN